MAIIWGSIGLVLLAVLIDSVQRYKKAERHELKALTESEKLLCAQIVDESLSKPWICRKAVDSGECPCLPCVQLERAKLKANPAA